MHPWVLAWGHPRGSGGSRSHAACPGTGRQCTRTPPATTGRCPPCRSNRQQCTLPNPLTCPNPGPRRVHVLCLAAAVHSPAAPQVPPGCTPHRRRRPPPRTRFRACHRNSLPPTGAHRRRARSQPARTPLVRGLLPPDNPRCPGQRPLRDTDRHVPPCSRVMRRERRRRDRRDAARRRSCAGSSTAGDPSAGAAERLGHTISVWVRARLAVCEALLYM